VQDRDLIVGVLAAQAGFVTPAEVLAAAAAGLVDSKSGSLLNRLESKGLISSERRRTLEALAEQALAARNGDVHAVAASLGGAALLVTLVSEVYGSTQADTRQATETQVPLERPGQYTRLRELGRGSQSVVRAARDEIVGREVALKELVTQGSPSEDDSSRAARARFLREVRLLAGLDHPGIVSILELARREDGTLFCAQKLIRGETLQIRLARCGSLAERLGVLRHVLDACQAVGFAHSKHVIHRDLKPSNIMVGEHGETVVVDWGLAKHRGEAEDVVPLVPSSPEPGLTIAGIALGTPAYMSPEQAKGDLAAIDARSDVFNLGAILYQLLTGRPPFEGATAEHILENVRLGRFHPVATLAPDAPPELAAIAERALRPEPAERYRDAEDLAKELCAYLAGGRVGAYHYGTWELVRKFVRRRRALAIAIGAALVMLLAFGANTWRQLRVARLNLASSLLERARDAVQDSDWGRAAGYYAASRIQHDSREARWGYALARQRMPHRVFAQRGADESNIDVGFLPGGVAMTVAAEPPFVIGRELDGGRELWRFALSKPLGDVNVSPNGTVHLGLGETGFALDSATGRLLGTFVRGQDTPCDPGVQDPRVRFTAKGLVDTNGPEPVLLCPKLDPKSPCAVSADGRRVAFLEPTGVVHLWDLVERRELASRGAPDASQLLFTAHGLAILRARAVQVFGGEEGDFFVAIPGRGGNGLTKVGGRGNVVSPDGHLLVTSRLTSNQADVVDLRTRTVVASFGFPPGLPRFSFSPASDRLLVAGLLHGSIVEGWELRMPEPLRSVKGSPVMPMQSARDGRRFEILHYGFEASRYEVFEDGALLHSGALGALGNVTISADGRRIAVEDGGGAEIRDAATGQPLWHIDCEQCFRIKLSADGERLLTWSPAGRIDLWDLGTRRSVLSRRTPVGARDTIDISGDGRLVLWSRGAELLISSVGGGETTLRLDDAVESAAFSYDGSRFGIVTQGSIGVWTVKGLHTVWRIPRSSPVHQEVYWSADDSALMILTDSLGTSLLDSATGERFATLNVATPGAFSTQEVVLPSLRHRISRGDGIWKLWPLPAPDDAPAETSLAQVLSESGLEMRGAELVDAIPSRSK
jgi:tRNA A-37 threonylcarbamoyl transferase component Bud32/WD40 repeat protein